MDETRETISPVESFERLRAQAQAPPTNEKVSNLESRLQRLERRMDQIDSESFEDRQLIEELQERLRELEIEVYTP